MGDGTSRVSAAQLAAGFEAALGREARADSTRAKYSQQLRPFVDWLGKRAPGDVSRVDLDDYLGDWYRAFSDSHGRAPAQATYRAQVNALRAFYAYLESTERLTNSAGDAVPNRAARIKPPARTQKAIDWLRSDEDAALLGFRGEPHEEFLIWLLRWTGIRVCEARAISVADVDLTPGNEQIQITKSKTVHGLRAIPLHPDLVLRTSDWLTYLGQRSGTNATTPLLATRYGTPMHSQQIWRIVKRVAYEAGVRPVACTCGTATRFGHATGCPRTVSGDHLSGVSPHTLRRTYASHLINKGLAIEVISKLLGHASIAVTQQYYAQLLNSTVRDDFFRALKLRQAA